MLHTLENIFTKKLSDLDLPRIQTEQFKPKSNATLHEKILMKVKLAEFLNDYNLLSEEESKIVKMSNFQQVMVTNPYKRAIKYLQKYKEPFLEFSENVHVPDDYPLEFRNNKTMTSVYVSTKVDHDYNGDLLNELLFYLEKANSREWVVDMLLLIEPKYANDDEKLTFVDDFTVLKYIGTTEEFRDHFTYWLNLYEDSNFEKGMDYTQVLKDFITEVAKYIPHIPECLSVYKKLKSLKPQDYEDNLDAITNPMYKITG